MNQLRKNDFMAGMQAGIPVCIGYFSVSFGFGAMAVSMGINVWNAILISASNLTSAGQFAGLTVIAAGGTLIEMVLTQVVINSRYALMGLALGQRMGPEIRSGKRLIAAFFDTDEVFAIGMSRQGKLTASYFVGAGLIAAIGWVSGTALGAIAGSILPQSVQLALGALLYGMFIAIVVPQARQENSMLACMFIALVLSCLFAWVPLLNTISSGLSIVICTVATAAICAVLFPIEEDAQ
jgi:predicted branched-subunit amino acid permease